MMGDESSGSDGTGGASLQGGADAAFASAEIRAFLKSHASSCPVCGLQLKGVKTPKCPGCQWVLDLETLKSREPTVANMVKWDWLCPGCGYNVKGINEETCPECGCPLTPQTLVHPEDAERGVRRPKTVAVVCAVIVMWLSTLALTAILEARGITESTGPCGVSFVLGGVVGWLVYVSGGKKKTPFASETQRPSEPKSTSQIDTGGHGPEITDGDGAE